MKLNEYLRICKLAREIAKEEMLDVLQKHDGQYVWGDINSSDDNFSSPVITLESDLGPYNLKLYSVEIGTDNDIVFEGIDVANYETIVVDWDQLLLEDIPFIISEIEDDTQTYPCPIKEGQDVYWVDPDNNRSSGLYKVYCIPDDYTEESVIMISNGYSEAEATIDELFIPLKNCLINVCKQ